MLHSIRRGRGVGPDTPPTAAECDFIATEITRDLKGLKLTRVQPFGPAGYVEGVGTNKHGRRGEVVGSVWALDVDRSWRILYSAHLRQQRGFAPNPGFGTNARRFIRAAATRDCDTMWLMLNVGSRFVRDAKGDKAQFCKITLPAYKEKGNGFADLAANPDVKPVELGSTRDVALFGVPLRSGRYMVVAMSGRLGGIANAEQKFHGDPSVLEFLTVRRPSSGR